MAKQKRRRFSGEEKTRILKKHLLEGEPVSAVCREAGISPTLFYQWQNTLFENAAGGFESKKSRPSQLSQRDQKIKDLEARLVRKNEVLSEAVEALVTAKKLSGDR